MITNVNTDIILRYDWGMLSLIYSHVYCRYIRHMGACWQKLGPCNAQVLQYHELQLSSSNIYRRSERKQESGFLSVSNHPIYLW